MLFSFLVSPHMLSRHSDCSAHPLARNYYTSPNSATLTSCCSECSGVSWKVPSRSYLFDCPFDADHVDS